MKKISFILTNLNRLFYLNLKYIKCRRKDEIIINPEI